MKSCPEMFYVQDPSSLNRPWTLSKNNAIPPATIPLEVTKFLKNYHLLAVEFLYHNYRKKMQGSILNQELGMNFPLQVSAFFRAVVRNSGTVLVICPQRSARYWHYHLANHGGFTVIPINEKNCRDSFGSKHDKLALLLDMANIKQCEELENLDFFSVVIENLDLVANKLVIKRLDGKFNVGLSCRNFYSDPDPKLVWKMLNWANPGCVGKLNDFYEIDNRNLENFQDNYRFWWMRLTWQFCESFHKPGDEEVDLYENAVSEWAERHSLPTQRKTRKRKHTDKTAKKEETEVPIDKYVKLPSMDESPILTSIIKNFEISPEPILTRTYESLPYTFTQPNCSKYEEDNSVILSFLDTKDRPSTSKNESEEFIINLIKKPEGDDGRDIEDILKEVDAVLQS